MKIIESIKRILSNNSYEAAGTGRRSTHVGTQDSSVNAENRVALPILRARARDMVRNNPYAAKAVSTIVSNTIGKGIKITLKGTKLKKDLDNLKNWLKTCDSDNKFDFYGLEGLILRTVVESGEALIVRERHPMYGLRIKVYEGDWLDSTKNGEVYQDGYTTEGIKFSKDGKVLGYWMHNQNPNDNPNHGFDRESRLVSADQVIHVFDVSRPGQNRGIPWGVSGFTRLRGINEYQDARVEQMKVAACFAGFITDDENSTSKGDLLPEKLEPGMFPKLGYGQDITFNSPPNVSGHEEFISTELHAVASSYGISYEALTGDFSKVNFSSGRMGWIEFQRNIERWQAMMVRSLNCIGDWYKEEYLTSKKAYFELTPPRREMVDPTREIPSMIKTVRAGFKPWQEAVRELGYDAETVAERIKEDNELFDKLGLILDSDSRNITNAGMLQMDDNNDNTSKE